MNCLSERRTPLGTFVAAAVLVVSAVAGCMVAVRGKPFGKGSDEWGLLIRPVTSPEHMPGDGEKPITGAPARMERALRWPRSSTGRRPRKDVSPLQGAEKRAKKQAPGTGGFAVERSSG
jgi:hypothetical protein